jgi:hypothetical protein
MPNARVPFFRNARRLRLRSCFAVFPFYFIFYARSHALLRERRRGSRTSLSLPAADLRPKRELKKEKRTARAVCMGAATSLRMTRTTFFLDFGFDFYFGFLFTYAVLEHGTSLSISHQSDKRISDIITLYIS